MTEPFKYAHDDPRVEQLARYMLEMADTGINPEARYFYGEPYRMGPKGAYIVPGETYPAWKAYEPMARIALLWIEKQGGSLP